MVALPWLPDIPAATKVVEQLALSILFENPQLRQSGEEDESALPLGYFSICHAPTTTEPTNQRIVWAGALRITAAFLLRILHRWARMQGVHGLPTQTELNETDHVDKSPVRKSCWWHVVQVTAKRSPTKR